MASSPLPSWMSGELPQPDDAAGIQRTFAGYREALRRMTPEQLMAQADRLAAMMQEQSRDALLAAISQPSSASTSTLDQPVLRTTPSPSRPAPSPRGRDALRSPSQSPPPSPFRLPSSPGGRRLAAKLVAANARSINGIRRR